MLDFRQGPSNIKQLVSAACKYSQSRRNGTASAWKIPLNWEARAGSRFPLHPRSYRMSTQPRRRRLEVEHIGDVTVVNFVDRKILDEQNIQIIGEQLFNLVDEEGAKKLLLNFSNVEYLSSAALGKLITLNKKCQNAGGRLILSNIDKQIHEVFEITKLDKFFKIIKDEQTALQAF